ncbi:MAG: AAA family ATPase [Lachnospiraceae bacterium]|nr:AAA family ATPase [Lachnospiraceae bacterium]
MKIRVGFFDKDTRYVNKLVNYLNLHYSDSIETHMYSNIDTMLEQIRKHKLDILLIEPGCVEESFDVPDYMGMAYFSTSVDIDTIREKRTICKYQKVDIIYKEILNLFSELDLGISVKAWSGECSIQLFIGASGGVGTTTVAAACAKNLAQNGRKVLYLNLESNGVISQIFTGELSQGLSDALYAVKSNHSNLILKLTSMIDKDPSGVSFLNPFAVTLDEAELTPEELEKLVDSLINTGNFESIIVDMDPNVSAKRNLIANRATNIFIVASGLPISNQKLAKRLQEFYLLDERDSTRQFSRVQIIYNAFGSKSSKARTEFGETIFATINNYRDYAPGKMVDMIASQNLFAGLV